MTPPDRIRRVWRAAAATTVGTALVVSGAAVANAAPTPASPVSLVVATATPTIERYVFPDGGSYQEGGLGAYLVAGRDPFELRVTRKSYADPLVANQVVMRNGRRTEVPLPAGMVTDFTGLKAFSTITMKDSTGATVFAGTSDFCPNSYASNRTRPDAPDVNPYPTGCSYGHPFLLGNVWGIEKGWTSELGLPGELDVPDGTYTTTIEVNRAYRDHFKIPVEQASATVALTVRTTDHSDSKRSAASLRAEVVDPRRAGPRDRGHEHDDEGGPDQVSAYSADLRPPARRPSVVAAASVPRGPRPDLRSLPALDISLVDSEEVGGPADGRKYIAFGATVWNAGTSPLVVDGFRRTGTDLMDAYQYFYDAAGKQVGSTAAGTMEWDKRDGHKHWHFTDFAQYRLLKADKKEAVRSGKEAFCLVNTDAVDDTIPNAKWRPSNTDLSSSCGQNTAVAVREVLDIGHGDTYGQYLPGQSFDVTDLPNGTYYIEVLANPSNRLTELSTTNNSSLRQVILSGSGADRKLTVPPVFGIEG